MSACRCHCAWVAAGLVCVVALLQATAFGRDDPLPSKPRFVSFEIDNKKQGKVRCLSTYWPGDTLAVGLSVYSFPPAIRRPYPFALLSPQRKPRFVPVPESPGDVTSHLRFLKDGSLLTIERDLSKGPFSGVVCHWDVKNSKLLRSVPVSEPMGLPPQVNVDISPTGDVAFVNPPPLPPANMAGVQSSVERHRDVQLFVLRHDEANTLVRAKMSDWLRNRIAISDLAFAPDGKDVYLLESSRSWVFRWRADVNQMHLVFTTPAPSPAQHLASVENYPWIALYGTDLVTWNEETGRYFTQVKQGASRTIEHLVISPALNLCFYLENDRLWACRVDAPERHVDLSHLGKFFDSRLSVSADGAYLAILMPMSPKREVRIYHLDDIRELDVLRKRR